MLSDEVSAFLERARDEAQTGATDSWTAAQREAYMGMRAKTAYGAEVEAYERLFEHQGSSVPQVLAFVSGDIGPGGTGASLSDAQSVFKVNGILMEYLEGFKLGAMADHVDRKWWQALTDEAVSLVHILGDNDILNRDVRPDNFIVVPLDDGTYRICMFDFGQCRFRRDNETEEQWGFAKYHEDETTRLAMAMKRRFERHGFKLRYDGDERYMKWAPGMGEVSGDVL